MAALALGGNLGPAARTLRLAVLELRKALIEPRVASLYRTEPVSPLPQPPFLNTAVVGRSRLGPEQLMAFAKALELGAGRRRGPRYGPRPLDIDLLLFGDLRSSSPELILPHPRLRERRFVLAPLAEIAPGLPVPPDGATVGELLARSRGEESVERLPWPAPGAP